MKSYLTCCVGSTAELIDKMVDRATEIFWDDLLNHVTENELYSVFDNSVPLEKDWAVSFYQSVYDGMPCVFVCHSAIEYIFT